MPQMTNRHILIVTALALECAAVLRRLSGLRERSFAEIPCHCGVLGNSDVTVACLQGMGNVNAAARVSALIQQLRPSVVLLVGIAGGTKGSASQILSTNSHLLGDVLVAEQIIDYESGKTTQEMEHRFRAFPGASYWLAQAKELKPEEWIHTITEPRPDNTTGRVNPSTHFGTFASGEKVIKSADFVKELRDVWTQLVAVEMEGLGVAIACHQTSPPTEFVVFKAICDWANPNKNDVWQPYAADAAASFAVKVIAKVTNAVETVSSPSSESVPRNKPAAKIAFTRRLADSWKDLADAVGITRYERDRFDRGDEARAIWEWLEVRNKLGQLRGALHAINRDDLAALLENPQ